MDHFYWSVQAWLAYRFNALSDISVFLLTMIALFTGLSPGLTAFALIAANNCRPQRPLFERSVID